MLPQSKDDILNFGGGFNVFTRPETDKPLDKDAKEATRVADAGEFGRDAAQYLGKPIRKK